MALHETTIVNTGDILRQTLHTHLVHLFEPKRKDLEYRVNSDGTRLLRWGRDIRNPERYTAGLYSVVYFNAIADLHPAIFEVTGDITHGNPLFTDIHLEAVVMDDSPSTRVLVRYDMDVSGEREVYGYIQANKGDLRSDRDQYLVRGHYPLDQLPKRLDFATTVDWFMQNLRSTQPRFQAPILVPAR